MLALLHLSQGTSKRSVPRGAHLLALLALRPLSAGSDADQVALPQQCCQAWWRAWGPALLLLLAPAKGSVGVTAEYSLQLLPAHRGRAGRGLFSNCWCPPGEASQCTTGRSS